MFGDAGARLRRVADDVVGLAEPVRQPREADQRLDARRPLRARGLERRASLLGVVGGRVGERDPPVDQRGRILAGRRARGDVGGGDLRDRQVEAARADVLRQIRAGERRVARRELAVEQPRPHARRAGRHLVADDLRVRRRQRRVERHAALVLGIAPRRAARPAHRPAARARDALPCPARRRARARPTSRSPCRRR